MQPTSIPEIFNLEISDGRHFWLWSLLRKFVYINRIVATIDNFKSQRFRRCCARDCHLAWMQSQSERRSKEQPEKEAEVSPRDRPPVRVISAKTRATNGAIGLLEHPVAKPILTFGAGLNFLVKMPIFRFSSA